MKTLEQVLSEMSPEDRKRVRRKADEMLVEQLTLQQLRKAHQKTQTQLARKLHMTQDQVSRIEQRSDLLLSTLRKFVEGMGGQLSLIAEFPKQMPVRLAGFSEFENAIVPSSRSVRRRVAAKGPVKRSRNNVA